MTQRLYGKPVYAIGGVALRHHPEGGVEILSNSYTVVEYDDHYEVTAT